MGKRTLSIQTQRGLQLTRRGRDAWTENLPPHPGSWKGTWTGSGPPNSLQWPVPLPGCLSGTSKTGSWCTWRLPVQAVSLKAVSMDPFRSRSLTHGKRPGENKINSTVRQVLLVLGLRFVWDLYLVIQIIIRISMRELNELQLSLDLGHLIHRRLKVLQIQGVLYFQCWI